MTKTVVTVVGPSSSAGRYVDCMYTGWVMAVLAAGSAHKKESIGGWWLVAGCWYLFLPTYL
jgi:hypothetical protein